MKQKGHSTTTTTTAGYSRLPTEERLTFRNEDSSMGMYNNLYYN